MASSCRSSGSSKTHRGSSGSNRRCGRAKEKPRSRESAIPRSRAGRKSRSACSRLMRAALRLRMPASPRSDRWARDLSRVAVCRRRQSRRRRRRQRQLGDESSRARAGPSLVCADRDRHDRESDHRSGERAYRGRLRICTGVARAPSSASARRRRSAGRGGPPRAAGDAQFLAPYGASSIVQTHAFAWQRYMHRYGATREALAALALNSRRNANLNPRAFFFNEPMTRDDYFNSRWIAEPLCLFDCDVPVDGCVALILTSAERARDLHQSARLYRGLRAEHRAAAARCSTIPSTTTWPAAVRSRTSSGRLPGSVRMTWTPRNSTTASILRRSIGWRRRAFARKARALRSCRTAGSRCEGELPVNTFGGSLSEGRMHGMGHIAEAVRQVTDRAEQRQIPGASAVCAIDGSPMLRGSGIIVTREP